MRQPAWDSEYGGTGIEWPANVASPHEACLQLQYHREFQIGSAERIPWISVYQHPNAEQSNHFRYLILLQMHAGYEVIVAKDLQRLLKALTMMTPLIATITANGEKERESLLGQ